MATIYDDEKFYSAYSQMTRSKLGLYGAGEWECVKTILPDVSGKRILDLGCGFGWHAKYFAQEGAKEINAIDISEKMLQKAKEINDDRKILYSLFSLGMKQKQGKSLLLLERMLPHTTSLMSRKHPRRLRSQPIWQGKGRLTAL